MSAGQFGDGYRFFTLNPATLAATVCEVEVVIPDADAEEGAAARLVVSPPPLGEDEEDTHGGQQRLHVEARAGSPESGNERSVGGNERIDDLRGEEEREGDGGGAGPRDAGSPGAGGDVDVTAGGPPEEGEAGAAVADDDM